MKLTIVKRSDGAMYPAYGSDYETAKKIKVGEEYQCEIKQPRNLKHHRKYFALLRLGYSNQDWTESEEIYRKVTQIKAGYCQVLNIPGHDEPLLIPDSIRFSKMDQEQFSELYKAVLHVIENELDMSDEQVEHELVNFY